MSDFKNQSPWGSPPGGGGSGNGGFRRGPKPPNIDEVISKIQNTINRIFGGGKGGAKPIIISLIILLVVWTLSGLYSCLLYTSDAADE